MPDVKVLLEVMLQGHVDERRSGGGEFHARAQAALDHGDHLAEKLIERAIEALGTGVASAVNLLDPEAVIVGGGLGVRFGERYMDPLTKEMAKHLFVDERPPAVRVASMGDLGGAIGASLLFSSS